MKGSRGNLRQPRKHLNGLVKAVAAMDIYRQSQTQGHTALLLERPHLRFAVFGRLMQIDTNLPHSHIQAPVLFEFARYLRHGPGGIVGEFGGMQPGKHAQAIRKLRCKRLLRRQLRKRRAWQNHHLHTCGNGLFHHLGRILIGLVAQMRMCIYKFNHFKSLRLTGGFQWLRLTDFCAIPVKKFSAAGCRPASPRASTASAA